MGTMNRAILDVSVEVLENLLHLPDGVRIDSIYYNTPETISLYIMGECIPESDVVPEAILTLHSAPYTYKSVLTIDGKKVAEWKR